MKKGYGFLLLIACFVTGCYYDNEEELYPNNTGCDLSIVTFSGTVNTVLNNNGCLGCHSGGAPSGNVNLQGHANVKRVADNGRLFGAINHSSGFVPMPQGGKKISACEISKVKAWIDAGAPNN